jgi:outer membrane protein assembly factor BamB
VRTRAFWVLLAAFVAVGCSSKGKVREPAELTDIGTPAFKLDTAWSRTAGEGSGKRWTGLRLALEPDALFTADLRGRVFAFNPQSGGSLWTAETKSRVVSGPGVSGNLVLVGTLDGEVIALGRADGKELWRRKLSSEVMASPSGDGRLVVARTGDGKVFGLNADNGEQLWVFDRSVPNLTLSGMSAPLVSGRYAYVGFDSGKLGAINLADGTLAWEQVVAVPTGRTELERLTDVDAALFDNGSDIFAASFGGEVICLDGGSGQVLWRRSIKSYTGFAEIGELVVISDEAGIVWAVDARTGAAAWKQEALLNRRLSPPAAFNGHIVVADFEGYLHWLDPKDGRIVSRSQVGGSPVRAAPIAGDNLLYVLNSNGKTSAVKVR